MPLHLLSKKSWNVYNPAAVARVRADEAAAAQAEEAQEQRLRDYEAERRLAILRGDASPPRPLDPPSPVVHKRQREDAVSSGSSRKRARRLPGEDDTDRDIRVARAAEEERIERRDKNGNGDAARRSGKSDHRDRAVPIVDHAGHIQLFAPPSTGRIRAEKNEQAERERKAKEREMEDQYTMRFENAAGFGKQSKDQPWYAKSTAYSGTVELDTADNAEEVRKNAFGRDDPMRGARDAARMASADPMAAMKTAQRKLKEVNRRKEEEERERAWVWDSEETGVRDKHRHPHKHRHHRRHHDEGGSRKGSNRSREGDRHRR